MAMVDLAGHSCGKPISINDIARRQELSFHYVEQLFIKLKRAGLLSSTRGSQGGYMLSKPAVDVTAGDIVRVVEGPISPVFCLDPKEERIRECPRMAGCSTRSLWEKMGEKIEEVLDSATLDDLVKGRI